LYGSFDTEEEARNYLDKLREEGVIQEKKLGRPFSNPKDRYIRKTEAGTYSIQKHINGVKCYFGTYHNLQDAREERDYLESIDWDYDNME
jgi:viroplasmin and RNaseH domain-containing protein